MDHVPNIVSIPTLAEKAFKHYKMMQDIISTKEAPTEIKEVLSKQDEILTILTHHIKKEKANVESIISESQKSFIARTDKIKAKIIAELDTQVEALKTNFKFCKNQYSGFYREDHVKRPESPSIAELMVQLNSCGSKEELENKLQKFFQDVKLGVFLSGTLETKVSQMERKIFEVSQILKDQTSFKPSADSILQTLKAATDTAIDSLPKESELNQNDLCSSLISSLLQHTTTLATFDSVFLKTSAELELLQNWIPPQLTMAKLLYRGSRDGYNANIFHQKCNNVQHTITILETGYGKKIGGYSDQTWNQMDNTPNGIYNPIDYKRSDKSFLFSITDKEIYPLLQGKNIYAINVSKYVGPCFGDGCDLVAFASKSNECNQRGNSYASVGKTYDAKSTTPQQFGGGYNFTVKEIEVFAMKG
jgi:hypothetical protein